MRRPITRTDYDLLLESYRESPGNHEAAARHAKMVHQTAKKGWEFGWPKQGFNPIKLVIDEERMMARAARMEAELSTAMLQVKVQADSILQHAERQARQRVKDAEAEGERVASRRIQELYERAHIDAAEQAAEEVFLSKSARKNALAAHTFIAMCWGNAKVLAERIAEGVKNNKISPIEAMELARELLRGTRDVNQSSKIALEIERMRVGDPTKVVEVRLSPASLEDAVRDIQHAEELARLSADLGLVSETANKGQGTVPSPDSGPSNPDAN